MEAAPANKAPQSDYSLMCLRGIVSVEGGGNKQSQNWISGLEKRSQQADSYRLQFSNRTLLNDGGN